MSFNFGSNLGANTAQTGFPFGGTVKTNTPTFGSLGSTQTQPSGSITFGTPIASVAPTQQNTGLSFGTSTLGTGLNFGTSTSAAPSGGLNFGTPAKTAGLTFGTPSSQSSLNFASPATQTGLNFGASPGLNFGTSTASSGLTFGAPNTAPSTTFSGGLAFGTPAAGGGGLTSSANPLGGTSFGGATATTSLSFGAPPSANPNPLGGISFGTPAATNPNPLGGINFGAPPATNPNPLGGINFGTPVSSTGTNPNPLGGISFGTPTSSTGFALGGTTTASTGLNFGLGSATTSTAPTLNFKSPATTTGLNFGFNAPKPPATTSLSLGTAPTSTTIGLGGVDSSQLKTGAVSAGRTDTVAAKENQVPNEILQSIESFKQFVKDQKSQSSDVSRGSARPFMKVREDIELINSVLTDVGNDLQRNQQQADKLKHDSAKCLHNAEMGQRTNDTPLGLQFENNAPLRYFIELVNQFEQDLQALRVQIDVTDKHFQSLHEPKFLTSQELATGMRRLHDTFVALAGRLHSVHTQVESQKEQYLNLRKYILKDPTNIFIKPASKEEQALDVALRGLTANKSFSGPTPFSSFGTSFGMNILQAQQNTVKPPPAYPAPTAQLNFGSSVPSLLGTTTSQLGASTSLFGNTTLGSQQIDNSFQLQNPPPGNKRGKR